MWSKGSKPPGEGKERRDVAMTTQAEMILKKKREIEAKMAADAKKEKLAGQPRKPISMSISKRWGLKGKKTFSSTSNENTPKSTTSDNAWKKYGDPPESNASFSGIGLPAPTTRVSEIRTTHESVKSISPTPILSIGPQMQLGPQQGLSTVQQSLQQAMQQSQHLSLQPHVVQPVQPPMHGHIQGLQGLQHGPAAQGPHLGLPLGPSQGPGLPQQGPLPGLQHHIPPPGPQQIPPPQGLPTGVPPPGLSSGFGPPGFEGPPPQTLGPHPQPIQYNSHEPTSSINQSTAPQLHIQQAPPSHIALAPGPGPPLSQPPPFLPQQPQQPPPQPQYDLSQPPPSFQQTGHLPPPQSSQPSPFTQGPPPPVPQGMLPPVSVPVQLHQDHHQVLPVHSAPQMSLQPHPSIVGGQQISLGLPLQSLPQPIVQPPPAIMTTVPPGLPPVQYPVMAPQHAYGPISGPGPDPIHSQPPPLVSLPTAPTVITSTIHQPVLQPPPPVLNQPPPGLQPQTFQVPLMASGQPGPSHPPPIMSQPPPIQVSLPSTHLSFPPPSSQAMPTFGLPDSSQPPPINPFPAPNTSVPPPMQIQKDQSNPSWWNDALAKAKTIATTLSKEGDGKSSHETSDRCGESDDRGRRSSGNRHRNSSNRRSGASHRNQSDSSDRNHDRGRDRGRDRSRDRHRSRSRNSKDSDRSRYRDHSSDRVRADSDSRTSSRGGPPSASSSSGMVIKEEDIKAEPEGYGYKSSNNVKSEVKSEPRDIDMRKRRRESESYSPTRPDYKPTIKTEVYTAGEPLPSVVEELASMVAVSGEDLEDIARDRNKSTPELKFLYERTGHLYRQYRARVAELKKSFEETKNEVKTEPGSSGSADPVRKRKSRWGDQSQQKPVPVALPPPGLANIGAPGVVIPTQLGGTVQKLMTSQPSVADVNPGLASYAMKVFGTTNLSDAQWKQCEDQMKMSVVYGQLAAKQAAAKIMAAAGKRQYEYDSDEDTEGGTWEHKARKLEMEKTASDAAKVTETAESEGKHHIGDFLPPEELSKFMNKYKAMRTGTPWDNSEYQENKLTDNNVGFKMLQKMGWSEGAGLGAGGHGITAPIGKSGNVAERAGLGADRPGEIAEDDDEFDAYRKRMMMAYRFRPNPLNNPRRSYY